VECGGISKTELFGFPLPPVGGGNVLSYKKQLKHRGHREHGGKSKSYKSEDVFLIHSKGESCFCFKSLIPLCSLCLCVIELPFLDIMSAIRIKKDSPLANVGYAVGINPTAQSHNQGGES
jgi:hypothetical protein